MQVQLMLPTCVSTASIGSRDKWVKCCFCRRPSLSQTSPLAQLLWQHKPVKLY